PGTGKTATIQSMIADELVRRALADRDAPVIVGTAATNQAVTNLLDSFSSMASRDGGPLAARWMPALDDHGRIDGTLSGIGVCFPARSMLDAVRKRHVPCEQRHGDGMFKQYSDQNYIRRALPLFMERATALPACAGLARRGDLADVREVRATLLATLRKLDELRRLLIASVNKALSECAHGNPLEVFRRRTSPLMEQVAALGVLDAAQLTRLRKWTTPILGQRLSYLAVLVALDEALDTTVRVAEFWLAVHIFEARWFESCLDGTLASPSEHDLRRDRDANDRYWPRLANLAPVVVMTTAMLPTNFQLRWAGDGGARETTPDFGRIDLLIVDEAGQATTPWDAPDGHAGLFLSEHYRCVPEIIGYCNQLMYDGRLVLCCPSDGWQERLGSIVPAPLSYVVVPGSASVTVGTSRRNDAEAAAIAQWIAEHGAQVVDAYRASDGKAKPLKDLLAVVTPFRAQAAAIASAVRSRVPGDLADGLVIGTAHKLQGAQRKVVLYSSVYGGADQAAAFVELNPNLMNVAVSRAEDAFVMFCAVQRLHDTGRVTRSYFEAATASPVDRDARRTGADGRGVADSAMAVDNRGTLDGVGFANSVGAATARLQAAGIIMRRPGDPHGWYATAKGRALGVRDSTTPDGRHACVYTVEAMVALAPLLREDS
ncbi:MAG: AAA domain-containing protein, partial [Bifidobacterium sp.]|nr:AAA domain-containing protein [Bifidobacterium sp.]